MCSIEGEAGRLVYRAGANYSLLAVTREIHSVSRANDRESVYYFTGVVAGLGVCMHAHPFKPFQSSSAITSGRE